MISRRRPAQRETVQGPIATLAETQRELHHLRLASTSTQETADRPTVFFAVVGRPDPEKWRQSKPTPPRFMCDTFRVGGSFECPVTRSAAFVW
jgi:hypothetical protein